MAHLLMVEDDADQRELRKLLLEGAGHAVDAVSSVDEALSSFDLHAPDIVLMDLRIPREDDGLRLIRQLESKGSKARIIVLSGWPGGILTSPEAGLISKVLAKPVRGEVLLRTISKLAFFCCAVLLTMLQASAASFVRFAVESGASAIVDLDLSSPGANWAQKGREAAIARIQLDRNPPVHLVLHGGEQRHTYSAFLGILAEGEHQLLVERDPELSAASAGFVFHAARVRTVPVADPNRLALDHAPVLFGRADPLTRFSDVPLLMTVRRFAEKQQIRLEYSVVFSNEDHGPLPASRMARFGRTADLEILYKVWLAPGGAVTKTMILMGGHREDAFTGRHEDHHPLLYLDSTTNVVSSEGQGLVRYQLPPVPVPAGDFALESVLDSHPFIYRVAHEELAREDKLRLTGQDVTKALDPRDYLYIEGKAAPGSGPIAAGVLLQGDMEWRMSHRGRLDDAVTPNGWFRTAIEVPPGTSFDRISQLRLSCLPKPEGSAAAGCEIERVARILALDGNLHVSSSPTPAIAAAKMRAGSSQDFALRIASPAIPSASR